MVGIRRSARLRSREDNKEAKRQRLEDGGDDQGGHGGAQAAPEQQEGYKKLPTEIWLHIFSFLPAQFLLLGAALVCKEWHEMAVVQKKHLQEVKFVLGSASSTETAARACRLIRSMPNLKIVRLHCRYGSVDVILRTVAKKLPGLEVLDLHYVTIRNIRSLELVAQSCQSLREVRLDGNSSYNCKYPRHILDTFSTCPKLKKFIVDTHYLSGVLPIDELIVRKWPKLTDVEFDFFPSTQNAMTLKIVIDTVGGQLRRLKVGRMGHTDNAGHDPYLPIGQCHQLEELIICKGYEVKKTTLVEVIRNLPHLRRLELGRVYPDGTGKFLGLFSLAQAASRLESLKLHMCNVLTDRCMSAIASRCLELTHVTFSKCSGFTYTGFYKVIAQCKKLKTVSVQGCSNILIDRNCRKKVKELNPNVVLTSTEQC